MKAWLALAWRAATAAAPFVLRITPQEFALLVASLSQTGIAILSFSSKFAARSAGTSLAQQNWHAHACGGRGSAAI